MLWLTCSGHRPTIAVLNKHATIAASKYEVATEEFYNRFKTFVKLFRKSGYDEGYLEGDETDVTRAYWSFIDCIKTEVTRINAAEARN
jgi:flagellar biosynthesis/type III secretory pathway protein FliH